MALKRESPGLQFAKSTYAVTPDEIDRYEVVNFNLPAKDAVFWASAGTAGTASAIACVIINAIPDYPRNINFALAGTATGMAGTLTVNGRDQFGNSITESLGFGSADNGGTVVGTKVFGQFTSGTLNYGTAVGNGTPSIGFVPGTNCLLGLPIKIAATADIVHLGMAAGTGAISYGGGTVAAFVNVPMHAIRPAATLTGTQSIVAWVKTTFSEQNGTVQSNGTQAV